MKLEKLKMQVKEILPHVPGWFASALMIFFTALWSFWGAAETHHEGRWGPRSKRLPSLGQMAVTMIPQTIGMVMRRSCWSTEAPSISAAS